MGAGAVNGKVYAFGGLNSAGSAISNTWEYDPAADSWTAKAAMPRARAAMGVAVAGGKVHAFGGVGGGAVLADVAVYDPAANTWQDLTGSRPMPTARAYLSATTGWYGLVYCVGGSTAGNGSASNTVEAFDPIERRWLTGYRPMPTARAAHAAGSLHGRIIVAGGRNGGSALDQTEEYDPETNSWRTLAAMSSPRQDAQAATIDSTFCMAGGSAAMTDPPSDSLLVFTFVE